MTGTSMDGLDLVCCRYAVEGERYHFEVERVAHVPYEQRWRVRLSHLHHQDAETFAKTHIYFGHWLGQKIRAFADQLESPPDYAAVHGQTIFHQPEKTFTFQLGDGETIAAYLDRPLVSNFRNKDVAMQGEGAPLIVLGEQALFADYQLFLNLGGICNLSFRERAFDVCPCNGVLNAVFQAAFTEVEEGYDRDGLMAANGQLDEELLAALNQLPYYRRRPPKSLGREWVEAHIMPLLHRSDRPAEDLLHTCCVHIAQQVAYATEKIGAQGQPMLITGGGRHHRLLLDQIRQHLAPLGVAVPDPKDHAWVDYKEAIVFGFLGLRTLLGKPTTLARTTGAKHDVVTGSIHLPPTGKFAFW
jgi:anhydro-N-acetylmuramic acid kinase